MADSPSCGVAAIVLKLESDRTGRALYKKTLVRSTPRVRNDMNAGAGGVVATRARLVDFGRLACLLCRDVTESIIE